MKEKQLIIKAYRDIFGKELGRQIGMCAYQMSRINETGLSEENMPEYQKLSKKFQALLNEAGGLSVIKQYNEKIEEAYHIKEKQNENYFKPLEKQQQGISARKQREKEAVKRFESYGIKPEWYGFTQDGSPVVCVDERHVYGMGSGLDCTEHTAYDLMLNRLLRYKNKMKFEEKKASFYISNISILYGEWGSFCGCTKKGKYKFAWTDMCANDETIEKVKQDGYVVDYYDQYMATTRYIKTTDDSAFQQISITMTVRKGEKIVDAILKYDIPEQLRDDILAYIRTGNAMLEVEDYSLQEKILAHFTEERLMKDAKNFAHGVGD